MFRLKFGKAAMSTSTTTNTGTNNNTTNSSNNGNSSNNENNNSGTGSDTTTDKSAQPIIVVDGRDGSDDIDLFLDILNNPCNYRGKVVYLTHIGPTARPDPFLWADKFYFNEGCEWFESPFALGALL